MSAKLMEMKLVNILEHKHLVMWIFFVCIHEPRMMYINSTHHFHGKGLFLFLKKYVFVTLVSRICETLY